MSLLTIQALGPIIITAVAITSLLSGALLLVSSPRLVYRIVHAPEQSSLSQSLLIRWGHLFFLEMIACLLVYGGLWLFGLFSAPPFMLVLGNRSCDVHGYILPAWSLSLILITDLKHRPVNTRRRHHEMKRLLRGTIANRPAAWHHTTAYYYRSRIDCR